MKNSLAGVVTTLLLGFSLMTLSAQEKDRDAPNFNLTDSTGKSHESTELNDKVVVLEWTNTDCPYVARHYRQGALQDLVARYTEKGVVWLAVNSTRTATEEAVEKWRKESKVEHPVLLDPYGVVGREFGAKTTPHLFVINKGKIVYEGAIDDDRSGKKDDAVCYVAQALDEVLAGKPVSVKSSKPYGCTIKFAPASKANEMAAKLGIWTEDFEEAKKIAKATGKPILLDFTGSDWCGWCIKLKKEVFSQPEFEKWAKKNVVLMEVDFPKRTPQEDSIKAQNEELKAKYPIRGYPTIVFIDASGKELGRFGYHEGGPKAWIEEALKRMSVNQ